MYFYFLLLLLELVSSIVELYCYSTFTLSETSKLRELTTQLRRDKKLVSQVKEFVGPSSFDSWPQSNGPNLIESPRPTKKTLIKLCYTVHTIQYTQASCSRVRRLPFGKSLNKEKLLKIVHRAGLSWLKQSINWGEIQTKFICNSSAFPELTGTFCFIASHGKRYYL